MRQTGGSALELAFWKRRVDRVLVGAVLVGGSNLWWFTPTSVNLIELAVLAVVLVGGGLVRARLIRRIRGRRTQDDPAWVLRV
jgi:hypothetical protein